MSGLPSLSPMPTPHSTHSKELLADIATMLGVDVSLFTLSRLQVMELTMPSKSDNARLILAFAKVANVRSRNRILELVEAQGRHAGDGHLRRLTRRSRGGWRVSRFTNRC